jgi:hypothetical protein
MVFFFFEKKKQKALFCFAEGLLTQTFIKQRWTFVEPHRASPFGSFRERTTLWSNCVLPFPEKEKALFCFAEGLLTQTFIKQRWTFVEPRRASPFGSFREKNNTLV